MLRDGLVGRELPLVRSHGDFTGSNSLYDAGGRLTGVIDWELSEPHGLPLLDLLQCFDLPSEYTRDSRWLRAEVVLDAVDGRGPLADDLEIGRYMKALALPQPAIPALLMMHWVDHAGARIGARKSDRHWFRHRVVGPLAHLHELMRHAPGNRAQDQAEND